MRFMVSLEIVVVPITGVSRDRLVYHVFDEESDADSDRFFGTEMKLCHFCGIGKSYY